MSEEKIEFLLKQEESERLERCESAKSSDKISKAICAFANDLEGSKKPGNILIGLKDNGDFSGLSVTDEMQRNIVSMKDNIQPFPVISVNKHIAKGCELIRVTVQPSKNPPLRYKGRCWIRVGSSVRVATQEEERHLTEKRQFDDLPYDMKGLEDADWETELNREYFKAQYLPSAVSPEVLAVNHREIKAQMRSLRLLDRRFNPTVMALLIMGKNPGNWLPGAYIQFVRFEGKELTDSVKDQKEISGTLPEQIQKVEDVFKANISIGLKLSDRQHIKSPDYPFSALQQLIRNAVIHRNYESNTPVRVHWFNDRIEIQSPGGPFGELNVDNFGQGLTSYRNPTIAEALKNLNFIERFGYGIPQARKALQENKNPELELKVEISFILAVVKKL